MNAFRVSLNTRNMKRIVACFLYTYRSNVEMYIDTTGNRHSDGSTIYYYLEKVNLFPNARSIVEEQPNMSNLAGLIHKYNKNIRASIN